MPLLAALGMAILVLCTLPAVHAQRGLEREHTRLVEETRAVEERVDRLERELRSGARQRYLRMKATRTLLQRGAGYLEQRDRLLRRR